MNARSSQQMPVAATLFCVLLLSLTIYPKQGAIGSTDVDHAGISLAGPALSLYGAIVLGVAYVLLLQRLQGRSMQLLPLSGSLFLLLVGLEFLLLWDRTQIQLAGLIQFGIGASAWAAGAYFAPALLARPKAVRAIATTILAIVAIQAAIAAAQRMGYGINSMDPLLTAQMGNRVNGTLDHPNNLGKIMLLLLILALGLLGTGLASARRRLWIAIVLAFVPLALSGGRANLLAAMLTLVFWAMLSPSRRSLGLRLGVPLLAVITVLPFAGDFVKRLEADPDGGPRAHLQSLAFDVIRENPIAGLGANSYVEVVSQYDAITAQGNYPVHNSFLLTAAELGIPAALLFWATLATLVLLAWRSRLETGYPGSFGLAIVASVPGLYFVLSTGWAMLSSSLLPLWFLVMGAAYSQVRTVPQRAFDPTKIPALALTGVHPRTDAAD